MQPRPGIVTRILLCAVLVLCTGRMQSYAQGNRPGIQRQSFHTKSGIVILGHAPTTDAVIRATNGKTIWGSVVMNTHLTRVALPPGAYVLQSDDEIELLSTDLRTYDMPTVDAGGPASGQGHGVGTGGRATGAPLAGVPPLTLVPVPWVADATFANNPPSFASRHTVFSGVATRFKTVIKGGTPPYTVTWDPGDGTGPLAAITTSDGYNGAAQNYTYNLPQGMPITATVQVADSQGMTASSRYFMIIGNPGSQLDRISRSTDEGLWYLHTLMQRRDAVSNNNEPATDQGFLFNEGTNGYVKISPTAMAAICWEDTGRSITGGKNLSNNPATDAYVDDLNRAINFLTDFTSLTPMTFSSKTYDAIAGTFNPDTHPAGGNGVVLGCNSSNPNYEGGMQLQAICQAGLVDGAVPNRTEYASYYDLIGDFVDGFQYSQATSGQVEGGWRYDFNYGDSDGSAVAWVANGFRAAEFANTFTPGVPAHAAPIMPDPVVLQALGIWIKNDELTDPTGPNPTISAIDYLNDPANGHTGQTRPFHELGGSDYQPFYHFYRNVGKTGGSLVALKLVGAADNDPSVLEAEGFLYRFFFTNDPTFGWDSARDAYGMYNLLKGLTEYHVRDLTDPSASQGLAPAGQDLDGFPLTSYNWYDVLADFIAGTSDTDLGHQQWPGNPIGYHFSPTQDGHFEPVGVRNNAIPPFIKGEFSVGSADANAGVTFETAWDIAVLQGTVFTPPPIAVIAHPNLAAGETFIPIMFNGAPYSALFDPAGSYEKNPAAKIVHVRWDFGDGSAPVEYDLATPSPVGGVLASNISGNDTTHHYTAVGDYVVKLTVLDDKGENNTTTLTVHVIPAPFPPQSVANFEVGGLSHQNGDTLGVLPDGTVTLKFDASASFNADPTSVNAPKNANGISAFLWEWPTNPASGFNSGLSESPPGFDEGALDTSGQLNPNSKASVQTYTFHFDPNNLPGAIIVGLRVHSNINQVNGQPPDTVTVFRQLTLKPNSQVTPGSNDLSISQMAPASPVLTGSNVTYTLTVTNKGVGAASTVLVTDTLPAGVTLVPGASSATGGGVIGGAGNNVTVSFDNIPDNSSVTISLVGQVDCALADGVALTNTASVSSPAPDPNPADNTSSTTISTSNPAPVITCPVDVKVPADNGLATAAINPGVATATDNCPAIKIAGVRSDNKDVTKDPYPLGTTTITWTATDSAGVAATCTQKVTVIDTQKPVVKCPADVSVPAPAGQCSAAVDPGIATATDNAPGVKVAGARSDGKNLKTDPYPVGLTTITWTATDTSGNTATCTQKVTVLDTQKPVITCPADAAVTASAGSVAVTLNPGTATATDNCPGVKVSGVRSDGKNLTTDPYPVGVTTITWTATDASGNTATCSQKITVNPGVILLTCPADVSVVAPAGQCSQTVNPGTATVPAGTPGITITGVRSDGKDLLKDAYPVGLTTITWTASNGAGISATCTQKVTVLDNEKPVITCPPDVTQSAAVGATSAALNPGTATATDNCPGVKITGVRSDGRNITTDPYPVGKTTITWTATDASGNTAVCTQNITVKPVLFLFPRGVSMASLPFDYTGLNADAAALFGVSVGLDGQALIATYDPMNIRYLLYPNLPGGDGKDVQTGRAYFIKVDQPQGFGTPGKPVASPFDYTVQPGWNMIADPFTTSVNLSDVLVRVNFAVPEHNAGDFLSMATARANNIIRGSLWGYSNAANQYTQEMTLQPYLGYWLFVDPAGAQSQPVTFRFINPGG